MEDNLEQKISRTIISGVHKGKTLAVLTSGGDSPGMNSAVRAVVRFGLYFGCDVFFVKEGYKGMVEGGKNIVEATWSSVSYKIHLGGTFIGSARCQEFRNKAGRLRAAKNLVLRDIGNLVVIGGDGSLTGAYQFKMEWEELLAELCQEGQITEEMKERNRHLNVVGMVGSIDNDFCGTDMTIGTDSALHRIVESVDAIIPTAYSHQRTFIMEVMGRNCGYLALVAGIVTEADYIFIPEKPPCKDWPDKLCKKLQLGRNSGQRLNIIIVAEGAVDNEGNDITTEQIEEIVVKRLDQDTRITVLGHIQRGGAPSAFDRILGCRMGAEAVMALMDATPDTEAKVITLAGNVAVRLPLMECVEKTKMICKAMKEKQWKLAVQLRGKSFQRNLETYFMLAKHNPKEAPMGPQTGHNLAIIHVGAPCCGMNAAVRSFVRNCVAGGNRPLAIHNGIDGLLAGDLSELKWSDVIGWTSQGGAILGTRRTLPNGNFDKIANQFAKFNIKGLFLVGGFESFHTLVQFADQRDTYPEFCIPMVVLPATISNNVPGTDFSVGSDTALNEVTEICDRIRQSAQGSNRRVFIIETMGGYCGYLATMSGLAGACDAAYIHEEKFSINDLIADLDMIKDKIEKGKIQRGLIMNNERACEYYTSNFIHQLYCKEGEGIFTTRKNILGHMQQGGSPSPFDRNISTKMAAKAYRWIMEQMSLCLDADGKVYTNQKHSAALLGMRTRVYTFQPVEDLKTEADFKLRRWNKIWWFNQRSILKILAHRHSSTYPNYDQYEIDGTLQQA